MAPTQLSYTTDPSSLAEAPLLVVIGRKARLRSPEVRALVPVPEETWTAMLDGTEAGDWGASTSTWVGKRKVVAGVLPEACSRHNSPSRSWAIPALARRAGRRSAGILLALDERDHALAAAVAVARAFPLYSSRSRASGDKTVQVCALAGDSPVLDGRIQAAMDGTRTAARLFDMPASELHTTAFIEELQQMAQRTGADVQLVRGEALIDAGLGGIWGVGRAAVHPPALVALIHEPDGAEQTVAWVGKGIVYDTGGLSIKGKTNMPGMKGDMGGAAAVAGAFEAAAATGFPHKLVAVFCLAENSVGPEATRPDDVLHMYSGKTVEVNNTDAEGRLVLADGVAWVCRNHEPDVVLDMATLTGAVMMTTGKKHAGVYSNDEALESAVVRAGLRAGEPCHPLIYAPELLKKEFRSSVADMKNSVKDRMNAQASCAGQFIANHLPDPAPRWAHIDIAGTAWGHDDRGTGFGVALLMEIGGAQAS